MPFVPFYSRFPDLAARETRSITRLNDDELPEATYGLVELYCNERGCDCRRVILQVMSDADKWREPEPLANISFGWEDDDFYRDWASFDLTKDDLDELRGPGLMRLNTQSPHAAQLLEHVTDVLQDQDYVARLIRHYEMFRKEIEAGGGARNRIGMRWSDSKRNQRKRQRKKTRRK